MKSKIPEFVKLLQEQKQHPINGYTLDNLKRKDQFGRLGKAVMKEVANVLKFSSFVIGFNKGGMAGSGEVSLKGMRPDGNPGIAIWIDARSCYFREIKNLDDSGVLSRNFYFKPDALLNLAGFVSSVKNRDVPFLLID